MKRDTKIVLISLVIAIAITILLYLGIYLLYINSPLHNLPDEAFGIHYYNSTELLKVKWDLAFPKPIMQETLDSNSDYPLSYYSVYEFNDENFNKIDSSDCKKINFIKDTDGIFGENNINYNKEDIYLEMNNLYYFDPEKKFTRMIFDLDNWLTNFDDNDNKNDFFKKYPFSFDNKCVLYTNLGYDYEYSDLEENQDFIIIFLDKNEKRLYVFERYLSPVYEKINQD